MIRYREGYKYQLVDTYIVKVGIYPLEDIKTEYIDLDTEGFLTIKRGYAWDGASGPTIDTKSSMRGSLVHDALYQLMRVGKLGLEWRYQSDVELKKICLDDGMWEWRALLWFKAVRKAAASAALPENKRVVHTAP